jgi:glycosyltransferase involved in cell wall biosynthesis
MLEHITPVLLTYNEGPNIARTLSYLTWARRVVVVDSGSTDDTPAVLAKFPNVRVFVRPFDNHANQWRYAVTETGIATPWILRLDADYQLTDEFIQEVRLLDPEAPVSAYRVTFDYAIFSQRLLSSLYPPNTILLRQGRFKIADDGHTEAWIIEGPIEALQTHVIHDDWKATDFWMNAQAHYMKRELEKLAAQRLRLRDRLRLQPPFMPFAIFFYCLFGKGLILNGRAGLFYALQRMVAESVLSLMVLETTLRARVELRSINDEGPATTKGP